jgi:hypothetical protein
VTPESEVSARDLRIDTVVERFGVTVEAMQAGMPTELDGEVERHGEQLASALLRLLRTHATAEEAFARPILEVRTALDTLCDALGPVRITAAEDVVSLGDTRLRFAESGNVGREFARELHRRGLGGFTFHEPLDSLQLRTLAECLAAPGATFPLLKQRFAARGLSSVELRRPGRVERETGAVPDAPTVGRAAAVVERSIAALGAGRLPDLVAIRRLVTEMAASGPPEDLHDEATNSLSPYAGHVLRVCHHALILGDAIGLAPDALQDLGVSAILHDAGYAAREGTRAADGDTIAGFAPPFERHAAAGARLLVRNRGFSEAKIRRIVATLEHHRDYADPSGRPSLFARILRIADDFDTLIRGKAISPAGALAAMGPWAGKRYDPVLLQVFVNRLGAWPPGTLLELTDGRVVRSTSLVRSPETFDKPVTELVRLGGRGPTRTVDLAKEGRIARALATR